MQSRIRGRRIDRRSLTKATIASLVAMKAADAIHAQDATPVAPDASPEAGGLEMVVLLTGLADPRFLAVDGSDVVFTEAGTGGEEEVFTTPGEGTPAPNAPISTTGHSGKLSRWSPDGTVTEIVTDFRSYTFGDQGEIVGPSGVVLDGEGSAYVAVGAPGPFVGQMPLTGEEGVVYKVDLATGEKEVIANLVDHEISQNPDPWQIDSNLYGLAHVDGALYVADAGGNAIIKVDLASGEVSTFAVTGGLDAPFFPDPGNPARGGEKEIDSVPSSVRQGPDGRLYVSYVTGGPFPPGLSPIDAFSMDGTAERVAEGLTMVGDIAFDSMGRLYASIISADLMTQLPGKIVRIEDDGSQTLIMDGMVMSAGIGFDAEDNLYALIFSSVVPGGGQLVRITGAADVPAGSGNDGTAEPEATPVAGGNSEPRYVLMQDTSFNPTMLTIPAHVGTEIVLENRGYLPHDLIVGGTDVKSPMLAGGQISRVTVNLSPGTYTYYCSQIGHRAMGMEGTLVVQ